MSWRRISRPIKCADKLKDHSSSSSFVLLECTKCQTLNLQNGDILAKKERKKESQTFLGD